MSGTANNVTDAMLPQVPREGLINTAVKFLQNPSVQKSSLTHRQSFLRSKGLTDEEVKIACERSSALAVLKDQQLQTHSAFTSIPINAHYNQIVAPQSGWSRFRDIANTIAIISGITYGLYLFFKTYIIPLLFGGKKPRKSIEDSISEIDKTVTSSVQELREGLSKVHSDLEVLKEQHQQQQSTDTVRQLEDLKADLASVKGLLLSRHQFASPVAKAPLVRPSIPDWQLTASEAVKEAEGEEEGVPESKGDPDIEEICTSGSGSSETEMVTNNGSDSSLEMIRE